MNVKEIIQENTSLFQEVIKEKLKEGKTPAVIIFVGTDDAVETFHREGTNASILMGLLKAATEYAEKLKLGIGDRQYYPENFKSE